MVRKFNAQVKFKLTLGSVKYVHSIKLNNNSVRKINVPSHNTPQRIYNLTHVLSNINVKCSS